MPWGSPSLGGTQPQQLGVCDLCRREVRRKVELIPQPSAGPRLGRRVLAARQSPVRGVLSRVCTWLPWGGSEAPGTVLAAAHNLLPPPAPESASRRSSPRAPFPSAESCLSPACLSPGSLGRKGLWIGGDKDAGISRALYRALVLIPPRGRYHASLLQGRRSVTELARGRATSKPSSQTPDPLSSAPGSYLHPSLSLCRWAAQGCYSWARDPRV